MYYHSIIMVKSCGVVCSYIGRVQLLLCSIFNQGIIDSTGMETYAEESVFFRVSVMEKFAVFSGALLRDSL